MTLFKVSRDTWTRLQAYLMLQLHALLGYSPAISPPARSKELAAANVAAHAVSLFACQGSPCHILRLQRELCTALGNVPTR